VICVLAGNDRARLDAARALIDEAVDIGDEPPAPPVLVLGTIGGSHA
jgi:hypothetical protein